MNAIGKEAGDLPVDILGSCLLVHEAGEVVEDEDSVVDFLQRFHQMGVHATPSIAPPAKYFDLLLGFDNFSFFCLEVDFCLVSFCLGVNNFQPSSFSPFMTSFLQL